MIHKMVGSQQSIFFTCKSHEEDGAFERLFVPGRKPRNLDYSGRSGSVVVRSVVNLAKLRRCERMLIAKSQMIVVRSDDNPFVPESAVRSGKRCHDIADRLAHSR